MCALKTVCIVTSNSFKTMTWEDLSLPGEPAGEEVVQVCSGGWTPSPVLSWRIRAAMWTALPEELEIFHPSGGFSCFNGYGATSARLPGWSGAIEGETRTGSTRPERSVIGSWRSPAARGSVPSVATCSCRVPQTRRYFFTITNSNFNPANERKHACKTVN